MSNIYYLPIKTTSLSDYINGAVILPGRFYKNRPSDIQNIPSDYIILSKEKFLNNSDCSIEIIFNDEELSKLIRHNENIFLYPIPIPTSRIKKIYFKDKTKKSLTIGKINRGTGFINEDLVEVINEENINIDIMDNSNFKYTDKLELKIKRYNHILGGIAFSKYDINGNLFQNYYSIISYFNYFIKTKIDTRTDKYDGAFSNNGNWWKKLYPFLYKIINSNEVEKYAKDKEGITIHKSDGLFNYELLDKKSITYILVILITFGKDNNTRRTIEDLLYDCKNEKIPKDKQEGIALIFGINSGYSAFYNEYDKKIVKFKMDSLLDYYTIESVFQYVINDKKDNEKFEYIDEIFPDEELVLDIEKKAFDLEAYSTNIFKYFTENILNISLKELSNNIINQFKNTFIEEMDKKDIKNNTLTEELQNKENQLKDIKLEIEGLNRENHKKVEQLESLNKKIITKDEKLKEQKDSLKELTNNKNQLNDKYTLLEKNFKNKESELEDEKLKVENLSRERNEEIPTLKNNFDEEKERIIIEQTLETYLKYDSKKVPELRKIAKEKGIKFTNKSDTIKLILAHER